MSKWFVVMEAQSDDWDYNVFDSSEDAWVEFVELRDSDRWVGVWRELRLVCLFVTDSEIEAYESATGEDWSLWDVLADAVVVGRWVSSEVSSEV